MAVYLCKSPAKEPYHSLLRNGLLLMQKEIIVTQKLSPTQDVGELEKRQYAFIDLMVDTILSDPDFKKEFFS